MHKFFVKNSLFFPASEWDDAFLNSGKSVYEVLRVIRGVPLFLEDHLERMRHSLVITGLEPVLSHTGITKGLMQLIRENEIGEGNIMFLFHYPDNAQKPYFIAWFIPHKYPSEKDYLQGVPLILHNAERENREAKVLNRELRERIQRRLEEEKVFEALLVDKDGYITEGSKSNFFAIRNGVLYTAPATEVLSGITRKYIYEICRQKSIPILEEKVHETSLHEFDACFISGTSPKVLPVSAIEKTRFDVRNRLLLTVMREYDSVIGSYVSERNSD